MADGGGQSELIGDLLQDEEQAEDGSLEQFLKREGVQFTAEEPAEDLDTRGGPRGEVGDGAFFNFGAFAKGLAKEDGGRRVTVRDQVDEHGHQYTYKPIPVKRIFYYMDTAEKSKIPSKLTSSSTYSENSTPTRGEDPSGNDTDRNLLPEIVQSIEARAVYFDNGFQHPTLIPRPQF